DSAGTVLAGPYHPAFRQLVESALCYELISKLTVALPAPGEVTVRCAPARVAEVAGQKRGNLERLQRERGVAMTAVIADPALSPLEIVVSSGKKEMKGNIVADLDYSTGGVFLG
ncbi:MAG TPA: radical SAM protein, partial [Geobacteraceae bacterium]|nr:radical SAM protein [Geobacteraceae bacterium]